MELLGAAFVLALVLAVLWQLRKFREPGSSFFWPWLDTTRGDRALTTYVVEEELKRRAEEPKDRDLAP